MKKHSGRTVHRAIFLLGVALASLATAQQHGPLLRTSQPNSDAVAVVIGIAHYQHRDLAPVEFAVQDATAVKTLLTKMFGYQDSRTFVLTEAAASIGNLRPLIRQELSALVKPGKSDLFVYYSGHGAPNVDSQEAYLLPWDYDPRYVPDRDSAYPLRDFYEDLKKLNARTTTVVLDACFSGQSEGGAVLKDASPAYIPLQVPSAVFPAGLVITAGGPSEVATWYRAGQHSLLTYYLLRGLQGEADPTGRGRVTIASLQQYLGSKVSAHAQSLRNRKQNPQIITALAPNQEIVHLTKPIELEPEPSDVTNVDIGTTDSGGRMHPEEQPIASVVDNNFLFTVRSCERSGPQLKCFGSVTNKDEKRKVLGINVGVFRQYTDLVDSLGNQYHVKRARLGVEDSPREQELEPDLPMNFMVQFDGVSTAVTRVSIVLNYVVRPQAGFGGLSYKVTLRNLPVLEK